jgi:hypothetical protein
MKTKIIVLSVLMSLTIVAKAQFSQFHAGIAFPSGKFADGDNVSSLFSSGKGMAAMGFTVGYKYYAPLSVENMSLVFGIEAFYNGLNSDAKEELEDDGWNDITFPKYLNFPVSFGLNYAVPLHENIKLYGEAAVGANFSIPTNLTLADQPGLEDRTYKFTSAFGFAYGLEGGLFIRNKYSIGLRYNNLGSYKYKYKIDYEKAETKEGKFSKALPVVNISLCLGILF